MRALRAMTLSLLSALLGCPGGSPAGDRDLSMSPADLSIEVGDQSSGEGDLRGAGDMRYPEDGCDTEHMCTRGQCLAPGEPRGCGICRNPDPNEVCTKDADCQKAGAKDICISGVAACTCGGQMICRPGCTSVADCGLGEVCGAGYRCVGRDCAAVGDCPATQRCSVQKRCERRPCTGSDTCAGFCVKGQCYPTPGQCVLPAA